MNNENHMKAAPVHQLVGQLRELLANAGELPWAAEYAHLDGATNLHDAQGQMVACDTEGWHGAMDKHDGALTVAAINALPSMIDVVELADAAMQLRNNGDPHGQMGRIFDQLTHALSLLPNATIQTAPSGARLQSLVGCDESQEAKP